ncbi:MAG: tRNA-dihydrouridine synthase [Myxococcales bacterium]|jgi:tRNA-dihydrouridine synthase C
MSPLADTRVARTPRDPGLFLALAPMDGVTDWVFRELISGLGAVSQCASEFVRITDRPVPAKVLRRHCPELDRGGVTASGVPVYVQLLGGEAEPMAESAALALSLGAPGIDLNFGCPAKTVNRHDGGASLLRAPARIERIVSAVRRIVPADRGLSVKIRTGWDDARDAPVLASAAEAGGADWITIHGRTRCQQYAPPVDWRAIGRAREAVSIPVVANGDLNTIEAVDRCRKESGCDAFMLGRAAMGRPRLFRALRGLESDAPPSPQRLRELLRRYCERMLEAGRTERGALNRMKQWLCYGSRAEPALAAPFEAIKRCQGLAEAATALQLTASGASWPPRAPGMDRRSTWLSP